MSRTDKTRPLWVKVADHPRFLTGWHDHREGPCDLPTTPSFEGWRVTGQRCTWVPSTASNVEPEHRCGCALCSGQEWRRSERRKERRQGRRYARDGWRREYA